MTFVLPVKYPNSNPISPSFPKRGSFKNDTSPGAKDGTPYELQWVDDMRAFPERLLADANITVSGVPDTAVDSDVYDAFVFAISKEYSPLKNNLINQRYVGSDGYIYKCLIDNGPDILPANPTVDPVGDTTKTWVKEGLYNAYLKYSDVKATGVSGGSSIIGTQTRTLNTEDFDTSNIGSLAANQITLPAGSYMIKARVPGREVLKHRALLYDVTGAVNLLLGESSEASANSSSYCEITGIIILGVTTTMEIRHYTEQINANGLGVSVGDGLSEIYTSIEIWRLE